MRPISLPRGIQKADPNESRARKIDIWHLINLSISVVENQWVRSFMVWIRMGWKFADILFSSTHFVSGGVRKAWNSSTRHFTQNQ